MRASTLYDAAAHITLFMMKMRLQTLTHLIHNSITVACHWFFSNVTILYSIYSGIAFVFLTVWQDIAYYWLWTIDYQSICGSHSRDFTNPCLSLALFLDALEPNNAETKSSVEPDW